MAIGIQAGRNESAGQAECAVIRCRFLRCSQAGFLAQNWNSLDWWFWWCLFEDRRRGVTNDPGCGNFHLYESVFRGSKDSDIWIGNLGYFSFVRNYSAGSAMFFSTGWGHTQGAQVTIQGNVVADPRPAGDRGAVVWMGNPGAWILLDNAIAGGPKPPVQMGSAGGDGQRPIVHLRAGSYRLDRTLVIPAGSDLQLVGDGMHNATTLNTAGADPLIRMPGPGHASVRHMDINGGTSQKSPRGIVIENADQAGGRIHMEQVMSNGYGCGLVVDGLDRTLVTLHDHGHNGIRVVGGPQASGQVNLFQGASSRGRGDPSVLLYQVERGGKLLVRDIWYEGDPEHFLQLADSGEFYYIGGHVATSKARGHRAEEGATAPVEINGFRGRVVLSQISANSAHLRIRGENRDLKALLMGWTTYPATGFNVETGKGQVGVLACRQNLKEAPGSSPIPDQGRLDRQFILEMLEPLRTRLPVSLTAARAGVTAATFWRVMVSGREGIRIQGR